MVKMSQQKLMKNIEQLGERYCIEHLSRWDKSQLKNNWWEALQFFFYHSFMRGRRDKLSNEYCSFATTVLQEYFSIDSGVLDESYERLEQMKGFFNKDIILNFKKRRNLGRKNSVSHPDFEKEIASKNPIISTLVTPRKIPIEWDNDVYMKKIFLGNEEDIMMVLDVLKLISQDNNKKNIYNYFKEVIQRVGLRGAWRELKQIRAIAGKIAALIIRDIGLMNAGLITGDYKYAFPIDTWVKRISRKLGYDTENPDGVKDTLISKCKEYRIEPLVFAAGLWFLGFHSLNVALECLDKTKL